MCARVRVETAIEAVACLFLPLFVAARIRVPPLPNRIFCTCHLNVLTLFPSSTHPRTFLFQSMHVPLLTFSSIIYPRQSQSPFLPSLQSSWTKPEVSPSSASAFPYSPEEKMARTHQKCHDDSDCQSKIRAEAGSPVRGRTMSHDANNTSRERSEQRKQICRQVQE